MKKTILLILSLATVFSLTGCGKDTYTINIVVPPDAAENGVYQEEFTYSDTEISPNGNTITISVGQDFGDGMVVLLPVEVEEENVYEPTYITPGMPVEMDVEKGAWFKIGVALYNNTGADKSVSVEVEGVEVRIE